MKSKSTTSTFIKLRDEIEIDSTSSHLKKLEARTWLLHASLLVYIKINQDFESIVELFLQPQYANTIQSTCPYLLRYLTFCVISTKRRGAVKDLIKFGIEGSNDPIVDVAEAVFVSFDFNDAQVKLAESKVILEKDYFLSSVYEIFIQNAKSMIFEAYCRVYSTIDIGKMAVKLGMDPVEGKKWILEVISETGMDAKINEETNSITTGQHTMPVEQQIQERVNGLKIRAAALEELVADKIAENAD